MSRSIVLLSGGVDSAAALAWAHQRYDSIDALSFEYYLRPFRERLAVHRLLRTFPGKLIEVPVPFLKEAADYKNSLPLEVPEGYVANRNLIFYSVAAHFAEMRGCEAIIGGHIGADSEAFPDSSESFFSRLQELFSDALLSRKISIELPLAKMTKLEVLQKAREWNVPLQYTWSCYWDGNEPCGRCISCVERAEAFQAAKMNDPLIP